MKRVSLLAAFLLGLGTTPIEARLLCVRTVEDCSSDWPRCVRRCVQWQRNHTYRLPEQEAAYGYRSFELEGRGERRHCKDVRRAVGDQHLTVEGAKKAANDAWAAEVRFHLGEKFISLENARDIAYVCSRSSIKEGGVTTLGQVFNRCQLTAQPCSPPVQGE